MNILIKILNKCEHSNKNENYPIKWNSYVIKSIIQAKMCVGQIWHIQLIEHVTYIVFIICYVYKWKRLMQHKPNNCSKQMSIINGFIYNVWDEH